MAIDPSRFASLNVIDTCAVWNVLSSATLRNAAALHGVKLCCTHFVRYECLIKRRSAPSDDRAKRKAAANALLQTQLRADLDSKRIVAYNITVEDLQQVEILRNRMNLSKGELTSIAFAMKTNQAFLTDDQNARKLADGVMAPTKAQTTPHMFAWLIFYRHLTDGDKATVIKEHEEACGEITPHLEEAYRIALQCRYYSSSNP